MAKFEVGEKAIVVNVEPYQFGSDLIGDVVTIIAIGDGKWYGEPPRQFHYLISCRYGEATSDERYLRKLPPDDTAEDPGLTRLKKLLQQDSNKHKQPVKV